MMLPTLNAVGCFVKSTEGKGRGVFASRTLPAHTLIEISPVLLFSKEEYETHGKYTILEHYTFKWPNGQMALALGLGSLFNHADSPNVSYTLDTAIDCIRYTTARQIEPDEELCIFYGLNLWFEPVRPALINASVAGSLVEEHEHDRSWGGLLTLSMEDESIDEDPNAIVPEDRLPFIRLKLTPEGEEEEHESTIRTMQAWVVDIPDARHTATMLKWLQKSGLETPELSHLKRVRKSGSSSTLLLSTSALRPDLPTDLGLSEPYTLQVPRTSALTETSLKLKSSLWPTVFTPRRKNEPEPWSVGMTRWARAGLQSAVREAIAARADGELPIAACVFPPHGAEHSLPRTFIARDTRTSANHPLRHATLNLIRQIADYHASPASPPTPPAKPDESHSKSHYLLTSLTVFTTHEPCIMCSMALLHSRVKDVFYLIPMPMTGGSGGLACLPRLGGVNHRFGIGVWKEPGVGEDDIAIDPTVDA